MDRQPKQKLFNTKGVVNPAAITFTVTCSLITICCLIEAIEFTAPLVFFIELFCIIVIYIALLFLIGFFWKNELYVASWTIAIFPLISILPILIILTVRKIQIDHKLNFANGLTIGA